MANNNLIVAAAIKYLGTYDGPRDFNSIVLAAANKYLGADPKRRSLNGAVLAALNKYTTTDGKSLNSAIRNACIQYGVTGRSLSTLIDKSMTKYLTVIPGPVNTVLPTISGTAEVGKTLTATDGTWTGTPTITYSRQWKANGTNISGATATTYVPVTGDIGKTITVTVTATNGDGVTTATSAPTSAVVAATGPTEAEFNAHIATLAVNGEVSWVGQTGVGRWTTTVAATTGGSMYGSSWRDWFYVSSPLCRAIQHALPSPEGLSLLVPGQKVYYRTAAGPSILIWNSTDRNGYVSLAEDDGDPDPSLGVAEYIRWDRTLNKAFRGTPITGVAETEYTW